MPAGYGKTLLEGLALGTGGEDDIAFFLRTLRWIAKRERQPVLAASDTTAATVVNSREFIRRQKIPKTQHSQVKRMGALLFYERWGMSSGGGTDQEGHWSFGVGRDVRRFANVRTMEDYRAAHERWFEESRSPARPALQDEPAYDALEEPAEPRSDGLLARRPVCRHRSRSRGTDVTLDARQAAPARERAEQQPRQRELVQRQHAGTRHP
jgi:hypothetical protein